MNTKQSINKSKQKSKKKNKTNTNIQFVTFSKSKNKFNRQLAETIATFYVKSLTRYQAKILNILISMIANKKYKLLVPSQGWIATQVGCTTRTVRTAMKLFHEFGIINKTSRGWRIIKKDFFRAMTCKYSQGKSLVKDMNFIHTYLSKSSAAFTNLWERIPALAKLFPLIFLVTSLDSYECNNIGSLRSPILSKMGYIVGGKYYNKNKSLFSSNFSLKGKRGYENSHYRYAQEDCSLCESDKYMHLYSEHNVGLIFGMHFKKEKERREMSKLYKRRREEYRIATINQPKLLRDTDPEKFEKFKKEIYEKFNL